MTKPSQKLTAFEIMVKEREEEEQRKLEEDRSKKIATQFGKPAIQVVE